MKLQDYIAANKKPPTLYEVLRRVNEVATLPHIVLKVIEVANYPESSVAEMREVIETDPAFCSADILRCVNSSAVASREKVSDLNRAISFVRMKQIRSLALTASVSELFAKTKPSSRTAAARYGSTSLLSESVQPDRHAAENSELRDAFVAGLLHYIGIVL